MSIYPTLTHQNDQTKDQKVELSWLKPFNHDSVQDISVE
jgi:hypothetical protein